MLDHIVGKPSSNWKRAQVLVSLLIAWSIITTGRTKRFPKIIQQINYKLAHSSPWRLTLVSWIIYYLSQNIFLLVGLSAPDPLARLYKRSFYRATWVLTALDAGFFTAMPFKPMWLRQLLSIVFTGYYLVFADAAEEKVRRIRATISVEQMRVSWEKVAQNPILNFFSKIRRPRLSIYEIIHVNRPAYRSELPPTEVYCYYTENPSTFADHDTILLHFPGGGFVSMPPPCHEDALTNWAKDSRLPVFAVNYKKAPEYPYPWPIEECFDLYVSIVQSKGKVIGLKGDKELKIIILGDSAGGNITSSVTLKIIAHNMHYKKKTFSNENLLHPNPSHKRYDLTEIDLDSTITLPQGLILIYPALDFEMSCWMSDSQLNLIRAESNTSLFRSSSLDALWQTKDHLSHASPLSVVPDLEKGQSLWRRILGLKPTVKQRAADRKHPIREKIQTKDAWNSSRLAMTSRMSFFNDRIITPDLMRAMAILYLGPHANPDFEVDYLLSPVYAPDELLAHFPKTYMMCGEKDPLVDDTVIFAGRIRQARRKYRQENPLDEEFPTGDGVKVKFLEGMSHAFLQMMLILPESHQAMKTISDWALDLAGMQVSDGIDSMGRVVHCNEDGTVDISGDKSVTIKVGDHHLAEFITNEKDMLSRRKQQLIKGLF
ncbi:Alpha/Beta hydrolase protein [Pilobolus umbonatus]|nr:Alpha/Beta hydrolase protein [Pilobolus umbonatus]